MYKLKIAGVNNNFADVAIADIGGVALPATWDATIGGVAASSPPINGAVYARSFPTADAALHWIGIIGDCS